MVALLPESFTVAPSAIVIGILVTITGGYRWAIWLGLALSILGLGLLCIIDVGTSIPGWIFLNIVPGLGLSILFPCLTFGVQASSTNENLTIVVAMFSFFRSFGQSIGVAIGNVVFQNLIYDNLLGYPALALMAKPLSRDAAGLCRSSSLCLTAAWK